MERPVCPRCSGDIAHIPADVHLPEHVKCMQCGWYRERQTAGTKLAKPPTVCVGCGRTGQSIQSREGYCVRCVWRRKKGLNLMTPTMLRGKTRHANP